MVSVVETKEARQMPAGAWWISRRGWLAVLAASDLRLRFYLMRWLAN
ncbi:hypothetical protein [Herbaspirillum autotrophicum]|nr:hypothetical protein [Herbaspirillum autotrophicum]